MDGRGSVAVESLLRAVDLESQNEGDGETTRLIPVAKTWVEVKRKKEEELPWVRLDNNFNNIKKLNLGPGGALGIGCGAGFGVAVVGGAGVGAWPWNSLKLVFGVGFGCGVGIGYGFGQGIGVLWDRPNHKNPNGKRLVIQI